MPALSGTVQDYLHGRQNLELDQELQRLQDSSEIVLLKFSSSSSDSVVLLQSEFQKVRPAISHEPPCIPLVMRFPPQLSTCYSRHWSASRTRQPAANLSKTLKATQMTTVQTSC